MSTLYEELQQLTKLHREGALSDAEFSLAKAKALERGQDHTKDGGAVRFGWAALEPHTIWILVVVALMLAFFFGFFLPEWNRFNKRFDEGWTRFDQASRGVRSAFADGPVGGTEGCLSYWPKIGDGHRRRPGRSRLTCILPCPGYPGISEFLGGMDYAAADRPPRNFALGEVRARPGREPYDLLVSPRR